MHRFFGRGWTLPPDKSSSCHGVSNHAAHARITRRLLDEERSGHSSDHARRCCLLPSVRGREFRRLCLGADLRRSSSCAGGAARTSALAALSIAAIAALLSLEHPTLVLAGFFAVALGVAALLGPRTGDRRCPGRGPSA
ncbi:hypothetical protein ACRAWD_02720 [Caulobacter segnis]